MNLDLTTGSPSVRVDDETMRFQMLSKLRIQYGIARDLFNLVKYSLYLASRDGLFTGERPFISSHLGPEFRFFFRGGGSDSN